MGHLHSTLTTPPLTLTFGIEIEFALALPLSPTPPTLEHVTSALLAHGIPAETKPLQVDYFDGQWAPDNPASWIITRDVSIRASSKQYEWLQVEVNSPVFMWEKRGSVWRDIERVLGVLKETGKVDCNRSCGVHVHVGNRNKGFALHDISNLLALLWTFEPQIEQIHPRHRQHDNHYCRSFRRCSQLARRVQGSPAEGLELLLAGTEEFAELRQWTKIAGLCNAGQRMAYWLCDPCALFAEGDGQKRTVEFRQHRATLDFEEIKNWVTLCTRLVEVCVLQKKRTFHAWLRSCIMQSPSDYPLEELLLHLDLGPLIPFYSILITEQKVDEREGLNETQVLYQIIEGMSRNAAAYRILEREEFRRNTRGWKHDTDDDADPKLSGDMADGT